MSRSPVSARPNPDGTNFSQYDRRLNKISMDLILALPVRRANRRPGPARAHLRGLPQTVPPLAASTRYDMPDVAQISDADALNAPRGDESLVPVNGFLLESTSSIVSSHAESPNSTQQEGHHTSEDKPSRSIHRPLSRSDPDIAELAPPTLTSSEQLLGRTPSPAPPAFARSQINERRKTSEESSHMGGTSKLHDDLTEQLAQVRGSRGS